MLYLSSKSAMDGSKAVRGGIPICFPNFGPWKLGAQHGFARTSNDWKVQHPPQVDDDTGDVKVCFVYLRACLTMNIQNKLTAQFATQMFGHNMFALSSCWRHYQCGRVNQQSNLRCLGLSMIMRKNIFQAALLLKDTEASRGIWNHSFEFLYTITLKERSLQV